MFHCVCGRKSQRTLKWIEPDNLINYASCRCSNAVAKCCWSSVKSRQVTKWASKLWETHSPDPHCFTHPMDHPGYIWLICIDLYRLIVANLSSGYHFSIQNPCPKIPWGSSKGNANPLLPPALENVHRVERGREKPHWRCWRLDPWTHGDLGRQRKWSMPT